MKHVLMIAGVGVLGYVIWKNHQAGTANATTAVGTSSPDAFNAGVANTSGNPAGGAAANIGANVGPSMTIQPVMRDSPSALSFFGGGSAAHPLDF